MRVEVLRAVRRAQAAVRSGVPEALDLTMLLLLIKGCGSGEDAREAARSLVRAFSQGRQSGKPLAQDLQGALQRPRCPGRAGGRDR